MQTYKGKYPDKVREIGASHGTVRVRTIGGKRYSSNARKTLGHLPSLGAELDLLFWEELPQRNPS